MNRTAITFALAIAVAASSGATAGAQQAPAAPRWVVDWGEHRCSLARTRTEGSAFFALRIMPGGDGVELLFAGADEEERFDSGDRATLLLHPAGTRFELRFPFDSRLGPGDRMLSASGETALIDAIGQAREIELIRGRRTLMRIPLVSAGRAVAAFRQCIDRVLVEWGIDPRAHAALRRGPIPAHRGLLMTSSDYPAGAIRRGAEGTVVARLTVDESGRVVDCAIVDSSGDADLDSTTCAVARAGARYEPAIGSDGQPTAATAVLRVHWTLPTG